MITIDFFTKKYREIDNYTQNQIVNSIQKLFIGIKKKTIKAALWDSNPIVIYSYEITEIKFELNSFIRVLNALDELNEKG